MTSQVIVRNSARYSALNLIAGAGIVGNVGGVALSANANLVSTLTSYQSIPVVSQFGNIVATGNGVVEYNIVDNVFAALTNSLANAWSNISTASLTNTVFQRVNTIMGSGDLGKFEQTFNAAQGFVSSSNELITSVAAVNSRSSNLAYQGIDLQITNDVGGLSLALRELGLDLADQGQLVNFGDLDQLGVPSSILTQLARQASLPPAVINPIVQSGISQTRIIDGLSAFSKFTDTEEKLIYQAMTTIRGTALDEVLSLLEVKTLGIQAMSDLLNPKIMYPRSYTTLTAPTAVGLRGIYIAESGNVNSSLAEILPAVVLRPLQGNPLQSQEVSATGTYDTLRKIIPAELALANKAIQAALTNIQGITNSSLPQLAQAASVLEIAGSFPALAALTTPLPSNVANYWSSSFAQGSGPDGTLRLVDIIGSPTGWVITANVSAAANIIQSLSNQGAFTELTDPSVGVYTVMTDCIAGVYTTSNSDPGPPPTVDYTVDIPPGLPGAGSYGPYGTAEEAVADAFATGLNPAMISAVANIAAAYPTDTAASQNAISNVSRQLYTEIVNSNLAELDFANLVPGIKPTGLVSGLSTYGLDITAGGTGYYFDSIANVQTQGGQAVVATMRETRNNLVLQEAGLSIPPLLSNPTVVPLANLAGSQYTLAQAQNKKIT